MSGWPQQVDGWLYRRAGHRVDHLSVVDVHDALHAFADDLLETSDARLALERAFRWGYPTDQGERVPGLQDHLRNLRSKRDRLALAVEHEAFLEALSPILDRIDKEDGSSAPDSSTAKESVVDRLLNRLEQRYDSPHTQGEFDNLVDSLRGALGGIRDPDDAVSRSDHRGPGQPGASGQVGAPTRRARVDRLRRMLFAGGTEAADSGTSQPWRRITPPEAITAVGADLQILRELEELEFAIARLEGIGSVTETITLKSLDFSGDDGAEVNRWLDGWSRGIASVMTAGQGSQVSKSIDVPPSVVRAIGRDLLKGLFRSTSASVRGEHQSRTRGNAGDLAEATREWEPGNPFDLDLVATMGMAIRRGSTVGTGRVDLQPEDFVVQERTSRVAVSTVLAIDRSRSMGQSGAWSAAKRTGLAMHELILQSYPRDALDILTFSSRAERTSIRDLPTLDWDRYEHGTHLQGVLALARLILRQGKGGTRQIVVVTDGEPTIASINGEDVFASPPTEEILNATMTEVIRCTREGVVINFVMLGESRRDAFAHQVARINQGRVFEASRQDFGAYIMRDYVSR